MPRCRGTRAAGTDDDHVIRVQSFHREDHGNHAIEVLSKHVPRWYSRPRRPAESSPSTGRPRPSRAPAGNRPSACARSDGPRSRVDRARAARLVPLWRQRLQLPRAGLALGEPVGGILRRVRDEVLAVEAFDSLFEAKAIIEEWRNTYSTLRPRSSLNWKTPAAYAASWRPTEATQRGPGAGQRSHAVFQARA